MTRRGRAAWLAAVAVLGFLLAISAVPATAQETGPPTLVRAIDATDPANAELQLVYGGDDVDSVTLISEGTELETGDPARYVDTNREIGLALVVDTSAAMDDSGALQATRDGIKAFADQKPENLRVSLIAAGDTPRIVTGFTSEPERIKNAADDIAPSPNGDSATWAAIDDAAGLLAARSDDLQPNLMVVTTGTDTVSAQDKDAAISSAASSGATSWILGFGGFDPGLEELKAETGGFLDSYDRPNTLEQGITTVGAWLSEDQWVVPFVATQDTGVVDLTVQVGGETLEVGYVAGRSVSGARELAPSEAGGDKGLPVLNTGAGKWLGLVLALVAVAVFIYAIVLLVTRDEGALSNVLQPYADGFVVDGEEEEEGGGGIAQSALIQRAVQMTEQVAESQGYLSRTEAALERANLPLRAGEALFFYVAAVLLLTGAALILSKGNLMVALVVGVGAALIPPAFVNFRASRRRNKFISLLPDTLQLLAGTLRAGYSLMQGVEAVSQEVSEPMGQELRRVVTEARLGRPLEESLDGVAERMASPDFAWAVMAIRIQREVGGNLSELLMTVADTMIQRERLRRDIAALTAEGRVSAMVLGLLPVGLGAVMFVISPDYIGQLFNTTLGNVMLVLAAVGMLVGFLWMRQIIKIEI